MLTKIRYTQGSPAVANQTKNIANTLTGDDQVQLKSRWLIRRFFPKLSPKAAQGKTSEIFSSQ